MKISTDLSSLYVSLFFKIWPTLPLLKTRKVKKSSKSFNANIYLRFPLKNKIKKWNFKFTIIHILCKFEKNLSKKWFKDLLGSYSTLESMQCSLFSYKVSTTLENVRVKITIIYNFVKWQHGHWQQERVQVLQDSLQVKCCTIFCGGFRIRVWTEKQHSRNLLRKLGSLSSYHFTLAIVH